MQDENRGVVFTRNTRNIESHHRLPIPVVIPCSFLHSHIFFLCREKSATRINDSNTCRPIPIRIIPRSLNVQHLVHSCPDPFAPGPGKYIRPDFDRLRALGCIPERDARHPQDAGFLLHPAGIGEDKAGVRLKVQEFLKNRGGQ